MPGDYPAGLGSASAPTTAVVASFTIDLLREHLDAIPLWKSRGEEVEFAPYGKFSQYLLTGEPAEVVVLLVRWADWYRHFVAAADKPSADDVVREFTAQLRTFVARSRSRILLIIGPSSPGSVDDPPGIREAEEQLARFVGRTDRISAVWAEGWAAHLDPGDIYDPYADQLAHIPYTTTFFETLAERIVDRVDGPRDLGGEIPGRRQAPPPDRDGGIFHRLVDEAGESYRSADGTAVVLPVSWSRWLPEERFRRTGLAGSARALESVLGDLVLAVHRFRKRTPRKLVIEFGSRRHGRSRRTDLFAHFDETLTGAVRGIKDTTVATAAYSSVE